MAPQKPRKLEAAGTRLWNSYSKYELNESELRHLEDAARLADVIARLEARLESAELIVKGSQGQQIANPLVVEMRYSRDAMGRLLGRIRLPDSPVQGNGATMSEWGRAMASKRWAKRSSAG